MGTTRVDEHSWQLGGPIEKTQRHRFWVDERCRADSQWLLITDDGLDLVTRDAGIGIAIWAVEELKVVMMVQTPRT